jgi:cation transport ATPase
MAKDSKHPVSQAINAAYHGQYFALQTLENHGFGLIAQYQNSEAKLGRKGWAGKSITNSTLATPSTTTRAVGSNTTRSQATGSKAITINVSIKDLIGVNNMNITNVKDGINKLQDMVVGALTGAVNDFQLIAE